MADICLSFQAHQPLRLKPYSFFSIGEDEEYINNELNRRILNEVAERCYLPANEFMQRMIAVGQGRFKFALSLSGPFLYQIEHYRPDLLESFRQLVATGCVELYAATNDQSLACIYSDEEFMAQVKLHAASIERLFGVSPKVLWNTGMLYSDQIAALAEQAGMQGIITDGVEHVRNGRCTNDVYRSPKCEHLLTFLRHRALSNDIMYRRLDSRWEEFPLAASSYVNWILRQPGEVLNLAFNYEILGEMQSQDSGIFEFFEQMIEELLDSPNKFITPVELVQRCAKRDIPSMPCYSYISWLVDDASMPNRHGQVMQQEALQKIFEMEAAVKATLDEQLISKWRQLQIVNHYLYMSTSSTCGFNPYPSGYDAYMYFMNCLADLNVRIKQHNEINAWQSNTAMA